MLRARTGSRRSRVSKLGKSSDADRELTSGEASTTARGNQKVKKVLTKQEVFDILDKEIEKIESLPPSTWGFTRDDIIEAIENIKDNLEELEDE